jgi:hypothetical protein
MSITNKLILLAIGVSIILAGQECKTQSASEIHQDNSAINFHKILRLQGISFDVSTSGQGSIQKLSIQPAGLSIINRELNHEIDGRVVDAEIEDLNADGYPEILIYTQSAGSGSYGDVIAYSVNNGKSVSQVYFPPLSENPKAMKGYMGHDEFMLIENSLARRFPIYKEGDTNANPTGGLRQVQYKLLDGEASRRFEIIKITDYPPG